MSEKTVVITESNGQYQIKGNGIPEFALIGILECVLFDLKTAGSPRLKRCGSIEGDFCPSPRKGLIRLKVSKRGECCTAFGDFPPKPILSVKGLQKEKMFHGFFGNS